MIFFLEAFVENNNFPWRSFIILIFVQTNLESEITLKIIIVMVIIEKEVSVNYENPLY